MKYISKFKSGGVHTNLSRVNEHASDEIQFVIINTFQKNVRIVYMKHISQFSYIYYFFTKRIVLKQF